MKASKILLNITSVFCFIYFAAYIFTLVFIPIGIYCFLAGKRFSYRAENLDDINVVPNGILLNYVIFASIFVFPFGLLSIIPYYLLSSNRISVSNVETSGAEIKDAESGETTESENPAEKEETPAEDPHPETTKLDDLSDEEKQEKLQKLENFREKGLITDEELEQAREQLFGKKK